MNLSDDELDLTRIKKGLYDLKYLKTLKEKYKDKPGMIKEINKAIEKIEKGDR